MTADPAHSAKAARPLPPQSKTPSPAGRRPRAPEKTALASSVEEQRRKQTHNAERTADRSVLRGLLWLALLALVVALLRAGLGRAFYGGWWRQW